MIIDSWNKVTIDKYLDIKAIVDNCENENEIKIELLSLLTDIDVDDLLDMPLIRFNHLLQNIGFIYTDVPNTQVATKYVLGGMKFNVMVNIKDMTTAQFLDYQTFVEDIDKNLVQLLSIFLIPDGYKYNDGYDIIEIQGIIRENLSIVDAKALSAFFLKWYESLLKATVHYLTKKMKKIARKEKNEELAAQMKEVIMNLEKSGDGLDLLTE